MTGRRLTTPPISELRHRIIATTIRTTAVTLVLMIGACRIQDSTDSAGNELKPTPPRLAKAGSGPAVDPLARYSFADSINVASVGSAPQFSAAGIRGDGRLITGVAAPAGSLSNEYQGNYCGVSAITGSGSVHGALNTDPDIYWTSSMQSTCGGARVFLFYLNGVAASPVLLGPHTIIDSLGVLAVGQSAGRLVRFGVHLTNCAGIRFGNAYPGSNDARVTRIADVATANGPARRWVVESQGSHRGACVISGRKDFEPTGVTYYMPFAITITEVLPPFLTYP